MTQTVSAILNKIHDVDEVNRLLVTAFVDLNGLVVGEGGVLWKYLADGCQDERIGAFERAIKTGYGEFTLEMLIEFFEFVVSPSDKVVTGAIYTPEYIRDTIVNHVFHHIEGRDTATSKIADIACGCGGFLVTVCEKILGMTDLDCHYIFEHILYGCDIEDYCIERSKILLALKAALMGERTDDLRFNLYQGDSLKFRWNSVIPGFAGFDAVVGNPPYVTSAKMSAETRELLKNWEVCSSGKADLYIPFFQIGVELLNNEGVLGYITVSNFYRSLNGSALRTYFANHALSVTIVDFGGEQVFKGCSTYTCLCFIDKRNVGIVRHTYALSHDVGAVGQLRFAEASYENLDAAKGWVIKDRRTEDVLRRITQTGTPLGEMVSISNGIATLKNEIYVLNVVDESDRVFIHEYDGRRYPIERDICRRVVKPSTMDTSLPCEDQMGWIIYPYELINGRAHCYEEWQMRERFPSTLTYLESVRNILGGRDKGKKKYEQWYAYGRSQAINMGGFRLLMPYIADKPTFFLSGRAGLMYYNGFALVSQDMQQLSRLKKILDTTIFWFYVKHISKPYANGYYSMGKRYIRYFGVPELSEEQLAVFDRLTERPAIEDMMYVWYFGADADEARQIVDRDLS